MPKQIDDQDALDFRLSTKKMELESGWLGKFFGNRANAPSNVSGFLLIVLALSGIAKSLLPLDALNDLMTPREYWEIIAPLVTLILGYMFGKRSNGD